MSEFEKFGNDIDPTTGNFIKKSESAPQPTTPETESSIDFAQMEKSFADGTAGEYLGNTGALSPEGLLEEQGDNRALPEISSGERAVIEQQFAENVGRYNLQLVKDENSLLAYAA
ncbi:MAG: hypothetical protein NTY30_02770 [Candidatus Berkelbacteria bacterium]|nr:hypothetical protein [Candidatus Berkelbacteria bacterium]